MINKLVLLIILPLKIFSQAIPQPNKVVIVILENHSYQQIIDSAYAPYIDSLASTGALFSDYHGLGYPSQPNYIKLFSGSDQGIINDNFPIGLIPFTTPNLASSLIDSGFTFKGYAESLDAPGTIIWSNGAYYFKHTPWPCWQGPDPAQHQLPEEDSLNLPFSYFPSDYDSLPDLCFVIPNAANNMHDGTDPQRITQGDNWIRNNLGGYINWCQANNGLFILTFDEDDNVSNLRVPLIIYGPSLVVTGIYNNYHNHYCLLRTLEDMFSLAYIDSDSVACPAITECWQLVSVPVINNQLSNVSVIPNPVSSSTDIVISCSQKKADLKIFLKDSNGKKVKEFQMEIKNSKGQLSLDNKNFAKGIYFLTIYMKDQFLKTEKIIFE
jgi:phosphatidylinositol-3-phosphatase